MIETLAILTFITFVTIPVILVGIVVAQSVMSDNSINGNIRYNKKMQEIERFEDIDDFLRNGNSDD